MKSATDELNEVSPRTRTARTPHGTGLLFLRARARARQAITPWITAEDN